MNSLLKFLRGSSKKVFNVSYQDVTGSFSGKSYTRGVLEFYHVDGCEGADEVTYVGYLYELDVTLFRSTSTGLVYGCSHCIMDTED